MTQFFAKKLNKKGFTLAELLIVIAIIAILVAIALPIFANYLGGARVAVHESNARAIKTMAIKELLSPSQETLEKYGPVKGDGTLPTMLEHLNSKPVQKVYATGTVAADGTIMLTALRLDDPTVGKVENGLGAVKTEAKAWTDCVDVSSDDAGKIDVQQSLVYVVEITSTYIYTSGT